MKIYINGDAVELADCSVPTSIQAALVKALPENQRQQSFALALNGDFVGKGDYANTVLKSDDSIDILLPIVGG
ncbi:sulfur carrier protein ThiS [Cognaticolwellia mytili]|uniref:sulfur carrier protein ThiS n=1 Tax=Cognaticolwellia mytili TaxID=1888913 RepID=UPI000A174C30|nr:sulfur carrier protein ThiS [Cognaticolwellia mytili]